MSQKLRNPFRLRVSERIESDANFLRLYSPLVIETLIERSLNGALWNNVLFIHSSPGAGKTSLLRIFEPSSLQTLYSLKSQDYSELYSILKKLNIFNEDGSTVLGVLLTCTRNYEILDDLKIDEINKKRLFFSLLNSRIILTTLRGMCNLRNLQFPDGLKKIKFEYNNDYHYLKNITAPCSGLELYQWALSLEKNIYTALDSLLPLSELKIEGHNELFALEILHPKYFKIDDLPICERFLFMLDDAHKLSVDQRDILIKYIIEKRGCFSIWISERKEVLAPKDNLGSSIHRDYEEINIEKFWQERPGKFEKIIASVASKRASASSEDINTFQENLEGSWNENLIDDSLNTAIEVYKNNINRIVSLYRKFDNWVQYLNNFEGSPYEKCLLYKKVEILINRNIRKPQLALDFALSEEELISKLDSTLDDAAKFFISQENNIPHYFGFSNLVKLSNNNIEQFLSFAASMFENILSNNLAGNPVLLTSEKQEKIIRSIVEVKWKELPKLVPYSKSTLRFLEQFAFYARKETFKPNAPIAQGVTGFAISNSNSNSLFEEEFWISNNFYRPLINVLSTCVAFNLLEPREISQGQKGQKHQVFYLNRWLCMKFNLPLGYGGWKSKKPEELLKWIKQ
ncbi:MAG: hypothetical protein ABR927_16240 [Bacteroidales bacterium]|jgi:hypothetical protein